MVSNTYDVIVVGAGLAGLSCAHRLLDGGRRPLVLERQAYVGGRTASWIEDGMPVESGHHRFLGFYKALPELLKTSDVKLDDILCWEDEVIIRAPGVDEARFGASPLFRPLRTVAGLLGNNHFIGPADKARLAVFLASGLRDYARRPTELDREDIETYARRHKVSDRAVERVVIPLATGIFFLPPNEYSAYAFFATLAKLVRRPHRMRVGAFEGGMTEVMAGPIAAAVAKRGGTVRTNTNVTELQVDDGRVVGVMTGSGALGAAEVVLATTIDVAQEMLRGPFRDQEWCRPLLSMKTMSAATIQMELSRPAYPIDRTIFGPGTVLASFGEQSRTTFKHAPGRLSIILAPPDGFVGMEPARVFDAVVHDAAKIGFDLRPLVTDYRVINEPNQFYALSPGQNPLRPDQATPVAGLTLAGGYTKQPWVDTMEGATVSGRMAAEAVLRGSG